jgi:hypothetical protein
LLVNHDPYSISKGIETILKDPNLAKAFREKSKKLIDLKFSYKNLTLTVVILEEARKFPQPVIFQRVE